MQIVNADDVKSLGTILTVWAHPDDETWSAAGILYSARQNGQKVCCVTATNGDAGVQDESRWPAHKLGKIREQEMQKALDELGVKCHHWLGYKDGKCDQVKLGEVVPKLAEIVAHIQPDTVLTFGPTGITGHTDHIAVGRWIESALTKTMLTKPIKLYHAVVSKQTHQDNGKKMDDKFDIFFNIDEPPLVDDKDMDICFRVKGFAKEAKYAAMRAQPSQTEAIMAKSEPAELEAMLGKECFVLAKTYK